MEVFGSKASQIDGWPRASRCPSPTATPPSWPLRRVECRRYHGDSRPSPYIRQEVRDPDLPPTSLSPTAVAAKSPVSRTPVQTHRVTSPGETQLQVGSRRAPRAPPLFLMYRQRSKVEPLKPWHVPSANHSLPKREPPAQPRSADRRADKDSTRRGRRRPGRSPSRRELAAATALPRPMRTA